MRRVLLGLAAVVGLTSLLAGLALAQAKKPDGTLTLTEGSVGVGIGFSWGKGTLAYQGDVFNLKKLEDFDGNYVAGGAGATVGGGAGITTMRNQNGVVIELKSTTQGASLKLAAEGIKLSVQK